MTGREGETFPGFFHAWGELPDTSRVDARCLGKGDALKNGTVMGGEKWGCGPIRTQFQHFATVRIAWGAVAGGAAGLSTPACMQPLGSGTACRLKKCEHFSVSFQDVD